MWTHDLCVTGLWMLTICLKAYVLGSRSIVAHGNNGSLLGSFSVDKPSHYSSTATFHQAELIGNFQASWSWCADALYGAGIPQMQFLLTQMQHFLISMRKPIASWLVNELADHADAALANAGQSCGQSSQTLEWACRCSPDWCCHHQH